MRIPRRRHAQHSLVNDPSYEACAEAPPVYYVIGPSGAGKDSVLAYVRANLAPELPVVVAHRYITRPVDAAENHVVLSGDEFRRRSDAGVFCLEWESHGHCYGIGLEALLWAQRGLAVVMNGSRGCLQQAAERFPSLVPVLISAPTEVLRARLLGRGRETAAQVEARISRAQAFALRHPRLLVIDNDGPLEQAGRRLVERIEADLARMRGLLTPRA